MTSYDLGMLRVFVLIYETGSVTVTSERLFLSQPSVSYTLRKLREHFGDPLFQRRNNQLVPTELAEGMYPKLRRLLGSLDDVMKGHLDFKPESSTRRFHLRLTDVGVSGLLPPTLDAIRRKAPQVTLKVEALNLANVVHDLRTGAADAAICTAHLDKPDILREVLFKQEYVGLCAANHPRLSAAPELAAYEQEEHVAVASSTGHSSLDARIQEMGIEHKVTVVIPNFSSLPDLLENSDLISYAPMRVAQRLIRRYNLRSFKIPFDVPVTRVAMYTLKRELPAADMDWFRSTIIESLQSQHSWGPAGASTQ